MVGSSWNELAGCSRSGCRDAAARLVALCFFSSRTRHTRSYGDWSSTCALPISDRGQCDAKNQNRQQRLKQRGSGSSLGLSTVPDIRTVVRKNEGLHGRAHSKRVVPVCRCTLKIGRASCRGGVERQVGEGALRVE